MTEHNAIEAVVAESYRTRIDAEELRREVKALLNEAIERTGEACDCDDYYEYSIAAGQKEAYIKVLKLIDEKEVNA